MMTPYLFDTRDPSELITMTSALKRIADSPHLSDKESAFFHSWANFVETSLHDDQSKTIEIIKARAEYVASLIQRMVWVLADNTAVLEDEDLLPSIDMMAASERLLNLVN